MPSALMTRSVSDSAVAAAAFSARSLLASALFSVVISRLCASASLCLARSSSRSLPPTQAYSTGCMPVIAVKCKGMLASRGSELNS